MARTKSKGSSIFVKIVLIAAIVYLSYLCINIRLKISDKKSQDSAYDTQISLESDRRKQLENKNSQEMTDEFIIDRARENGYSFRDEKVYESIS